MSDVQTLSPLAGRTALVTGASRGIGRAVATRLSGDGALVAVHYGRDEAAAKEVVEEISAAGGRAFAVHAELGAQGDIDTLLYSLDTGLAGAGVGPELDIVVNNAGYGIRNGLADTEEADFDRQFAVNVKAPFFLLKRLVLRLRDGGRIINLSSGVTRIAFPALLPYAMTKGAVDVLTRTLAQELGPRGITVNGVAPGVIDTDANAGWFRDNPEAQAGILSAQALGRVGQPRDIADVVAFLASDDARWVTGHILDATGGSRL